jgi:hypothetical protein
VVEDLHWADQSTCDLLAFLARNLRRERVLLVVTYRNDEPGQQQLGAYLAELDRGGRVERIQLSRLDQAQTGAQLVGILGTAPTADLINSVFARSEGNPFFTEELLAAVAGLDDRQLDGALRAAVAQQLLVTDGDGYDVRHALLREVIDGDLLPGERMRLHAGLAQVRRGAPAL